ncbi:hypothetical protein GCM10009799_00660 [Nocardiopsis rhodophaea]|uniref:Tyr recombinase domain-containing protein n=1 Tax=Nocardiopsis rhodophaea TaxID=280238 RepID=A0ABN2S2W4_9ACTN
MACATVRPPCTWPGDVDMRLVQELLRHSTIKLTADTYTSVLLDAARAAAEKAAALIPHTPTERG